MFIIYYVINYVSTRSFNIVVKMNKKEGGKYAIVTKIKNAIYKRKRKL